MLVPVPVPAMLASCLPLFHQGLSLLQQTGLLNLLDHDLDDRHCHLATTHLTPQLNALARYASPITPQLALHNCSLPLALAYIKSHLIPAPTAAYRSPNSVLLPHRRTDASDLIRHRTTTEHGLLRP